MGRTHRLRARLVTLIITGVAAGCGRGDGGGGRPPPPTAGAVLDAVAAPPSGAATTPAPLAAAAAAGGPAMTEQLAPDFYRASGGQATFIEPRLPDDQRWQRARTRTADGLAIRYTLVDGARRAQIEVGFPAPPGQAVTSQALAEGAARALTQTMPGARALGGRSWMLPGGAAAEVRLGAELGGAQIVALVTAIVDDGAVVTVNVFAHAELLAAPAVKAVIDAVYQGVRVGGRVLRPPPAAPGAARAGAYVGLGNRLGEYYLRIFDPRGYVYDDDALDLDLDARYQRADGKVARYRATADEVRVTTAAGAAGDTLTVREDALILGRYTLCPVAATAGLTLAGTWASTSFTSTVGPIDAFSATTSSRYTFTADGRYATTATASATLSATATGAQGVAAGDHDDDQGRYALEDGHLVLTTAGGATSRLPFYLRACGGKPSMAALIIAGALYLHED
ncbi:MAG: hypothetical protein IPL61_30050 [Myxococcales bacterium]|nr:hypothetical protein [Myxococcales bacterium]